MAFTPSFPKPHRNKSSFLWRLVRGWNSWLDVLFERSYKMKMGHYRQPGLDIYMVNEPKCVRKMLVEQPEAYPKHHLMHDMLRPLLGESIFTTNGEVWQRQRRLMDQAFEQARLKLVFPLMQAAITDMTQRLDLIANGSSQDVDSEMTHITADIIFRTILSKALSAGEAHHIFDSFIAFQNQAQRAMILKMYRLPSFFARKASAKHAKAIREILASYIAERYAARDRGDKDDHTDILGALMEARDPVKGDQFTYAEMVDQICMLFLAGHETSASALAWALYLISRCPDLQERMYQEILDVAPEREFVFSDIKKLKLTADVFKETLRLYPPVGFFVREAAQSHCMRDKAVEQGSAMLISPWLIQRHQDCWSHPHEFDPDRFATPEGQESLKHAYLPFSMGERVCIGAAFAMQEAVLVLATLVRRYHIEADLAHEPKAVGRVTIRSDNGIRVKWFLRQEQVAKSH